MLWRLLLLLYAQDPTYLIVPGVRIGPITRTSTERSLLAAFGKDALKQPVDTGQGMMEPGLVLYPDDPARRLEIVWTDETPAHPATIFICPGAIEVACRWRTATGVGFGTTLKDLERRNGKPFEMVIWGSDVGGNVTSFRGGTLERELQSRALFLTLDPALDKEGGYVPKLSDQEKLAVQGEKFVLSSDPVLQKLNPHVDGMRLQFAR
ncbi:MAG: hypothetical protein JWP63_6579 [Candidatus Solibacter sp.]|nr:hypothetical protein [Candidatus Solibacter sp.]